MCTRHYDVRILQQRLYMHQIFGGRLGDVHSREIDLASQQSLIGGCRVGRVDVKGEARVAASKSFNHLTDESLRDRD